MSNNIVQFNEEISKGQIKELVRGSVKDALIEMDLAGVTIRRVENAPKALWAARCLPPPLVSLTRSLCQH